MPDPRTASADVSRRTEAEDGQPASVSVCTVPQAAPSVLARERSDTTGTGQQLTILTVSYDAPMRAAARIGSACDVAI